MQGSNGKGASPLPLINDKPIMFAVIGTNPMDVQFIYNGNKRSALANHMSYLEMFRMLAIREELDLEQKIEVAPAAPHIFGGGK